jgi:hypothetical protein
VHTDGVTDLKFTLGKGETKKSVKWMEYGIWNTALILYPQSAFASYLATFDLRIEERVGREGGCICMKTTDGCEEGT